MNAISIDSRDIASDGLSAGPLYFPQGDQWLFGWLHRPSKAVSARIGVVICKPFGFEAISSHLSVRAFAEAAADLGIPSLRFDYAGTGDSTDLDPNADQVETWVRDIAAAVVELQRLTGVERICLFGFRLGALLAALAASRCQVVNALMVVAPIISGQRYLRELRTFELAATRRGNAGSAPPPRDPLLTSGGAMEISGFLLSAATIDSLSQIDLMSLPVPPVADLLVFDRNDAPAARAWTEASQASGVRTEYLSLAGFAQMMMRPPHLTVVPQSMIAVMRAWLLRIDALPPARPEDGAPPNVDLRLEPSSCVMIPRGDGSARSTEHPVFLGSNPRLFGIVTEPPTGERRRRGVILLNSGGDYHIGPRRMYVSLARRWAERGYVVLRMDLAGLGDSAARLGRPGNEVFPLSAIDDVRASVDFMRTRYGVRELTIGGLCSGAYHTLRAAIDGLPVNRILVVNPLNFFWEEGMKMDDVQPWEVVRSASFSRAISAESWRRLFTGDVSVWRVAKIYLRRLRLELQSGLLSVARPLQIRVGNDIGWELKNVAARGIHIVFVFSRGDIGISLLEMQSGLSSKKLGERYRIRIIDGADHDFTRSASRAVLEQVLSEELFARPS